MYAYLPKQITDVKVIPVVKINTLIPFDSSRDRPLAVSNSVSKLIDKVILSYLADFPDTSAMQFGLKRNPSTDMCIFTLKETVSHYRSLNTPIFAWFIDMKILSTEWAMGNYSRSY